MDFAQRECLVARLVAGCLFCRLNQEPYLLKQPDRLFRYLAEEVYQEVYRESELSGHFSEEELLFYLTEEGLWSADEEDALADLEKNLEELKVKLYELQFKKQEQKLTRRMLAITRTELARLREKRHVHDLHTSRGVASAARLRYLVAASLYYPDGRPVFPSHEELLANNSLLVDQAFDVYAQSRLEEAEVRELARTEPWRSLWACRKSEGQVFGVPAADLSEEQKGLITWSTVYDNLLEHPDAPSKEVLDDDDMLDGWLILQRRKHASESRRSQLEALIGSDKIKNCEEVFIKTDNVTDARLIDELNDAGARLTKKKRFALIQAKGCVQEQDLPDAINKMRRK